MQTHTHTHTLTLQKWNQLRSRCQWQSINTSLHFAKICLLPDPSARTLIETHFSSLQLLLFLYYWRLWCQARVLRIDPHNLPYSPYTPGPVQCTATQCSNKWKLWCLSYLSTVASMPLVLKVKIDWPLCDQLNIKNEMTRFGPKNIIISGVLWVI